MTFLKYISSIGATVLASVLLLASSAEANHREVNGCGDDTGLGHLVPNQPTGVDFRPSCDNHDRCYGTLGQSRQQCDNKFRNALRARCESELLGSPSGIIGTVVTGGSALGACYSTAEIYYRGVRERGGTAYHSAQRHAREEQNPTPTTIAGNYRLPDGTIFASNASDAYCTFNSVDHLSVVAGGTAVHAVDSFPPLRNDGSCPVRLPAGAYRLFDGRIIASNGTAFCRYVSSEHYQRKDGRPIRSFNGNVPLFAMENHFDCHQ